VGNVTWLWIVPLVAIGLTQIAVIATSTYLHRALAHRSLTVHPAADVLFRAILWLTTGQNRREWVAVHRKHHAFTDRDGDPHSPRLRGFWHVQFLNAIYYAREARNPETIRRFAADIREDRLDRVVFSRGWTGVTLGTTLLCLILGLWPGLIVAAVHGVLYVLVVAPLINGLGHWRGAQTFSNSAYNSRALAWMTGGESLHNNHHAHPRSPRFSARRLEFDPSWVVIRALAAVRLVGITGTPIPRDARVVRFFTDRGRPMAPLRDADHSRQSTRETDHWRAIDRYIDYFGDPAATRGEPPGRPAPTVDEPHESRDR
jgi:stearoyl-CoA desaturase (Delta-9 desaturase)